MRKRRSCRAGSPGATPSTSAVPRHSSPVPVNTPPLTYFEGDWSSEEKERLQAAVREVEGSALAGVRHGPGAPWVLTSSRMGDTGIFVASRHGFAEVLTASSAGALGKKISEFGRAQETSSVPALVK